jgi:FkbM family methyltransferase
MKSAAAGLLGRIARTRLAGPALRAVGRLGRAGVVPGGAGMRAARILSAPLGDAASTMLTGVTLDQGSRPLALACDLRFEQYRQLFFTAGAIATDRQALRLMRSRVADVDAVFDVGANAGVFAYAAAAAGARRVFAFEPIPRLASLIRENAERNGAGATVRVRSELVGAEDGTASFYRLSSDMESTMLAARAADRDVVEELTVPVVRLDTFCAREGLDPCRVFFKVDVEGNEMAALAGLDAVLARADAPDIITELLGASIQDGAIDRLAARGYQIFYLLPEGPIQVRTSADWSPRQNLSCWDFFLTKRGLPSGLAR